MAEHFKYEEMTDEELIDQLREGDRQVMDYICDKYKNLVRSKAKSGCSRQCGIMTAAEMPAFIPLQICVSADRCTRQCRLPSA